MTRPLYCFGHIDYARKPKSRARRGPTHSPTHVRHTGLWGVVGMILAVPLTAIGKIILENIRETKPLATLISNE